VGFAFGRWLDAVVPRLADLCVSVSAAAASRVSQCQVPTVYLPPAVSYGEAAVRLEGAPELVYLGNLDGYQSVEVMLGALELLASRGVRCAFVTGDHRAQALVRSHGLQETVRVVHHGEFAEVKRHLESARVALLPRTVSSGFPIKLVNYLAAGRPVVACKSGAQGLGQSEGVSVVPDGDERAFAGAVVALLEDPRQAAALGAAARATYEARFCWPSSVERFEEVYSTLLRRKRALP
jgi:glycosyltransferase involved in cell wall biosynthesis